jgi:cobalt-zinc-cadmium efflux system outer membrane protein
MGTPTAKRVLCWIGLVLAGGCSTAVRNETNAVVCERADRPVDTVVSAVPPSPKSYSESADAAPAKESATQDRAAGAVTTGALPTPQTPDAEPPPVRGARAEIPAVLPDRAEPPKPSDTPRDRLKIPGDLPGARIPPLELPSPDPAKRKEREEAIRRTFPDLPPLGDEPAVQPGPNGAPLTLTDLQRLALANNPALRQAAAQVQAARGNAVQAGLWPNPTVGFQGDNINTASSSGYLGLFVSQTIKTMCKPQLARASALIDVLNAELALRRAEADTIARVRGGYFGVLVARENVKVSRALAEFADEVYHLQVELLKAAQSPAYESLQLRVLSAQARAGLVQARNHYVSAWKQLATALGLPALPPTELGGDADMPAPRYDYHVVLERVLKAHTDVATALNGVQKAQIDLKLARVTPIPDVNVNAVVQKDNTTPPFNTTVNVQVGMPIPVWDRNQGAIQTAEAGLVRAEEESGRVRNDLTARVAEAFERYDNNLRIVAYYRAGILPDQVRAYRALYLRRHREPDQVTLQDVVNAQQILAQSVTTYISTLNALWVAVVDVANLLQTEDLYADTGAVLPCGVSVLHDLLAIPPGGSCCPRPDPLLKTMDGSWPAAPVPPPNPDPEKLPEPKKMEPAAPDSK